VVAEQREIFRTLSNRPPRPEDVPAFRQCAEIVKTLVRMEAIDPTSNDAASKVFLHWLTKTSIERADYLRALHEEARDQGIDPDGGI